MTAQLGGGIQFDGGTKQITFVNPYTGNGPHTISAWIDQKTATGTCDTIVAMGNPATQQSRWFDSHHTANTRGCVGFYGNDWFNPSNMNLENDNWLTGTLDEVRLATTARNAGWIRTESENQRSPTTFYSVGAEQLDP